VLRLLAVFGLITVMFAGLATMTASASDNPGPGDTAVWDHSTWPGLFGSFESDVANGALFCTSDIGGNGSEVLGGPDCDGRQEVYFASVANGDDLDGDDAMAPYDTSVTVQNLDIDDAYVFFYVGDGGGGWSTSETAYLSGGASKTFSAADLGIGATPGRVPSAAGSRGGFPAGRQGFVV